MSEQWLPIPGEDGYEASSQGRVRYMPSVYSDKDGYLCITVNKATKRISRLVLQAFSGEPPEGPKSHAAHVNGDVRNNTPENLYWATVTENAQDRIRHGTQHHARGTLNGHAKLTEQDVREIRLLVADGMGQQEVATLYGVSRSLISLIKNGSRWTHA